MNRVNASYKKSSLRKRLLKGSGWAATGKLLRSFAGLGVNALLARVLTAEELGVYFLSFTVATLLSMVARLGMGGAAVRLVAESVAAGDMARVRAAIRVVLSFTFLGVIAVSGLYWIVGARVAAVLFKTEALGNVAALTAVWIIVLAVQEVIPEIYRGFDEIGRASLYKGVLSTVVSAIIFGAVWVEAGVTDLSKAILISIAACLMSNGLAGGLLGRRLKGLPREAVIKARDVWGIGWPYMVSNIALVNLSQAAVIVLGIFLAPDEVALYVTAMKLMIVIRLPQFIANAVIPPLIVELNWAGHRGRLERLVRGAGTGAALIGGTIFFSYIVFGREILSVVYGAKYGGGYMVLWILAAGQMINLGVGPCANVLLMTGHQHLLMRISVMTAFICVFLAVLAAPRFGSTGVAVAFSTGLSIQSIAVLMATRSRLGIWTHAQLSIRGVAALIDGVRGPTREKRV